MDVNTLIDLLVLGIRELGGPLEQAMTQTAEYYAYYYPKEMLIACAFVQTRLRQ